MSTLEDLDLMEQEEKEQKDDKKDGDKDKKKPEQNGDSEMKDVEAEKEEDPIDEEIYNLSTQDILTRQRLLENDSRIMKSEFTRLTHEKSAMGEKIKDNLEKIENNRYMQLPRFSGYRANIRIDNYHTLLATLLSFSTSIQLLSPQRKAQISTSMQQGWANLQLLRPRQDRPFSCHLSVWLILRR